MKSSNPPELGLLDRLASYTNVGDAEGHPIHNLHPYPAKYIPKLPREVIAEHVNERHRVLDPFCGSGTTLVEAALQGVRSVGVDSNPVAAMISRAKTTSLNADEIITAERMLQRVAEARVKGVAGRLRVPEFPRIDHWFQKNVQRELSWIFSEVNKVDSENLRGFLRSVASSIVTSVSNQDSETRYTAVCKSIEDGFVLQRFERKLRKSIIVASEWASLGLKSDRTPEVINSSISSLTDATLGDNSIDLIVTSPPYPNSFDYYLYHKMRMVWLGFSFSDAQSDEIGSRYEHSSKRAPIDTFIARMRPVMSQLSRVLKPSKLAYLFVGDSVINGSFVNMSELYADLAKDSGFKFVDERSYGLNLVSRSFKDTRESAGASAKQKKMQRVVLLESTKSSSGRNVTRPAATVAPTVPVIELSETPRNKSVVAIRSDDSDRHVHSLIPYPSKFIPEIPRWAVREYSNAGDTVLDPFSGSGTTAVEAMLLGRNAVSVDISPWASLLARAKTTVCETSDLLRASESLQSALIAGKLPENKFRRFELDEFWFNLDHINQFSSIRGLIESSVEPELRDFFLVSLASTIRAFSYQDPAQIKVKRDAKKVAAGTASPVELFLRRLPQHVERLARFNQLLSSRPSHRSVTESVGDWASRGKMEKYDLVVTSPPYINAMNYAMSSRYELLLLDLLGGTEINEHQKGYYGTERVYAKDYKKIWTVDKNWSSSAELNDIIRRVYAGEPKRSYIVYDFFVKMRAAFLGILENLRLGGHFVIVTGTNTIRQVPIDTHRLLTEIAVDLGCELVGEFHYEILRQRLKITRHATAGVIPHDGVAILKWNGGGNE
ncbi:site-specific DNA-methyltransferase [Stenotrophomonas sp. G106K1]|uniref:site-specific DNA-methyltransferase n=1 Tax=Stenotrophomonas sp. G106K1 TaxID=3134792 RepID=UPI0030F3AD7A